MIRTRPNMALLGLVLIAAALGSCGKKGPLEQPSATGSPTSSTATGDGDEKDEKQDEGTTAP